ncbi:phosphoribosylamine--glycine ligase [bacterium]|nr:MAG: phosphoribosylamine--glycine ligase [bacterium]
MRILVIGSGGREHALVWKLAQSKSAGKIFCAPGNAGIAQQAECINIKAEDVPALLSFAQNEKIDFTIVGPEAPLASGIVDEFTKAKLKIFGPSQKASQLEASKVFSKEFMAKYKIPTAGFRVFTSIQEANNYIDKIGAPCVVKADGLAQGKGVVVAKSTEEAKTAVSSMIRDKVFGEAGNKVIVEECLEGQEASILVLTDSKDAIPLASSQDHKRVFNNDAGPNTGGMGAYSPAPVVTEAIMKEISEKVINRTMDGLRKEGIEYRGILYAGIMITKNGPQVLEYNVRLGDPETQAVLPRMESDLLEAMVLASEGNLSKLVKSGGIKWDNRACVCVVCTSKGYPGNYEKGKEILGLDDAAKIADVMVFHAGTKKDGNKVLTNGGRVLGVIGLGKTIKEAINTVYHGVYKISFQGMHFRSDIGNKALNEISA